MLAVGLVLGTAVFSYFAGQETIAYLMAFAIFMYACIALYGWLVSNSDVVRQQVYLWAVFAVSSVVAILYLVAIQAGAAISAISFYVPILVSALVYASSFMASAAASAAESASNLALANIDTLKRLGLVAFLTAAAYFRFGGVAAAVMAFCATALLAISTSSPVNEAPVAGSGNSTAIDSGNSTNTTAVFEEPLGFVESCIAALPVLPMLVLIVAFPSILLSSSVSAALIGNLLVVTGITFGIQTGYFQTLTESTTLKPRTLPSVTLKPRTTLPSA
jgi:hypothetical protein